MHIITNQFSVQTSKHRNRDKTLRIICTLSVTVGHNRVIFTNKQTNKQREKEKEKTQNRLHIITNSNHETAPTPTFYTPDGKVKLTNFCRNCFSWKHNELQKKKLLGNGICDLLTFFLGNSIEFWFDAIESLLLIRENSFI